MQKDKTGGDSDNYEFSPNQRGQESASRQNREIEELGESDSDKKGVQDIWRVVGASEIGTKHLKSETPCQDSHRYKLLGNGIAAVAVSDGAGSVENAEEGSALASGNAIDFLEIILNKEVPSSEDGWRRVLETVFEKTRLSLLQYASESQKPVRDYSATLILAVLADEWTAAGLIGDCAAVALDNHGDLFSLCAPQKGKYANMTNFLTQEDALDRLDIQIYEQSVQGVAVVSDGLLELAVNISQNKPHKPFFSPLFEFVGHVEDEQEAGKRLCRFIGSERINARTDDDKTLVIARKLRYRATVPGEHEASPAFNARP